jgi:S-adenosylmethionine:tRNA ribosyltransferase-isomerase
MEAGELPLPERFEVPISTARAVNRTVVSGGSIIAVGTTVTRALETVAEPDGLVKPGRGWTDLVVGQGEPVRVVRGLITGLHEPLASHLLLLEAVAGADRVQRAYEEAIANGYLWHEFGDSCFFLP